MLKHLHIENIAVIENTDIDFNLGFNALTGETGAGKSIIIDSINAVLGERTSKDLIRNGSEKAEVTAIFTDISEDVLKSLEDFGVFADTEGNILIERIITSNSSTVRINGKQVTVGLLKEIGKYLINIHGQHDNQGLLDPLNHCTYIDSIADNKEIIDRYYKEFKNLNSIRKELSSLETDEETKLKEKNLLEFQIDEIKKANIKPGEYENLKELEIADNYKKILSDISNAYTCLNGTENSDGAASLIDNSKDIDNCKLESFNDILSSLSNVSVMLDDIAYKMREYMKKAEYSEKDSEKLRERIDFIYNLMLKYGNSEQLILDYLENAEKKLEGIYNSDTRINELSDELDLSTERLIKLGDELTLSRKTAADKFSKEVCKSLEFLDMAGVTFKVNINKGRYTKKGCDEVEFYICTNIGEDAKPLHKIASGGELSRIMLAIKSVLADKDNVDTLIFDEIDTGISGRAAGKVGTQLRKVSNTRQVICVTHLAQIASAASNHLLIEKSVVSDRTYTNVIHLDYENRIKEIARIMSGSDITDNLYNSAKELLDRSF